MPLDRSFIEKNRASVERIRALARCSDQELQKPVGEHWTVAIALIHIAFWDARTLNVLDQTEQAGKLVAPEIDMVINDLSLPIWGAVPPRQALQLAIESAEALNQRLESFPHPLLEQVYGRYERWVYRNLHRGEHLDEIETALK